MKTHLKNTPCDLSERPGSGSTPAFLQYFIVLAFGVSITPLAASCLGEDNEMDASTPQMGARCDPKPSAACWELSICGDQTPTLNSYPSLPS